MVMAYRNPASGRWPNDYTSSDSAALIKLWGRETTPIPTVTPDKPNGLSAQVMDSNLTLFKGTFQGDWIIGNGGNNTIKAKEGNYYLQGRLGNDRLIGNKGMDTLRGGAGDDIIQGSKGADIIRGDRIADIIRGGRGADVLYGNTGQNIFSNSADGSIDVLNIQCEQKSSHINIIEELDLNDQINLIGSTNQLI